MELEPESGLQLILFRASSIGDVHPPKLTITAHAQIQDFATLAEAREFHKRQGAALSNALLASLPGGTIDALICEMLQRRSSLFSVPF